jgi:Tfp pilus assembly PilM family ATPase
MKINFLSKMKARELVAIDFSSSHLKLCHARVQGQKIEIINLKARDITGLSDEDISKNIRSVFSELKAKQPEIINIIPTQSVITKNIEIPSVNPQEIKEIINLQAGRHTPFSREEVIVDYIEIGTFRQSYTKILLVIVARQVIKRQFDIINKAGLKLQKVLFGSEALAHQGQAILKQSSPNFPAAIVNIDAASSDFTVTFKNKLLFVRSIPIGAGQLLDDKERSQVKFAEEIKRSLEAYQNEDIEKMPMQVILTGASQEWKEFEVILGDVVHLPVSVESYFKSTTVKIPQEKTASFAGQVSFLGLISSLNKSDEMKINLIPEEIKLRRALEERGKDLIKSGIFVLFAFVLVFFIFTSKIYFKNTYLANLQANYKSLDADARKLDDDFSRISLIKSYLSKRGLSLEALTALYDVTPLGIEFSDIRFDEQGKFSLKGTAESMSVVFSFVDTMEKTKYFKDVKTRYTTKRKEGLRDVTDFEINCMLKKEPIK